MVRENYWKNIHEISHTPFLNGEVLIFKKMKAVQLLLRNYNQSEAYQRFQKRRSMLEPSYLLKSMQPLQTSQFCSYADIYTHVNTPEVELKLISGVTKNKEVRMGSV